MSEYYKVWFEDSEDFEIFKDKMEIKKYAKEHNKKVKDFRHVKEYQPSEYEIKDLNAWFNW